VRCGATVFCDRGLETIRKNLGRGGERKISLQLDAALRADEARLERKRWPGGDLVVEAATERFEVPERDL